MVLKMNLTIITKNYAADPEIGFLKKSISKPNGRATAMPTAWELIFRKNEDAIETYLCTKINQRTTIISFPNFITYT